ncbi:MAG TPA: DUF72 domain-containing protein [Candidatus Bathyarchaeota archaeon]|nr:DUF72 domain-containing protein [Candidatus Bathyarchaeota archaeon]
MKLKIGCCGFIKSRKKYYEDFKIVEIQRTFYKPPMVKTAEKWRAEAPEGFEFTMKAWQLITHPYTSPTWRKAGIKVEDKIKERYGHLQPTRENIEAWNKTVEIASRLQAKIIVIQCPPSFKATEENISNARTFLEEASRSGYTIGLELRHKSWTPEKTRRLLELPGVIHVTDLLKEKPVIVKDIVYSRLHGLDGINYRYKYTDQDLKRLLETVNTLAGFKEAYILFNNGYNAYDDAKRLIEML